MDLSGKRILFFHVPNYGYHKVMIDAFNRAGAIVDDLGGHFEILDTYTKLYPTCRHMHQPIENIMALKDENSIDYHNVERIIVKVSQIAYNLSGQIVECEDAGQARFSIPTAVALTLKYGDVNLSLLSGPAVNDVEIKELARKVIVIVDKEVESLLPKVRCAIVDLVKTRYRIKRIS